MRTVYRLAMTIPPITRFLTLCSLALFASVHFGYVREYQLWYIKSDVRDKREAWRIPTSFLFGSRGLNYVVDLFALYRHSDLMESGPYAYHSPDYAWQLILACTSLIVINHPLQCFTHQRALALCVTHLYGLLSPNTFLGIPLTYLSYVLALIDFAQRGRIAAAQSLGGLIVGHLWYFLFWRPGKNADGSYRPHGPWAEWGNAPAPLRWIVPSRANADLSEEEISERERERRVEATRRREDERRQRGTGEEERRGLLRSDYRAPPMPGAGCCRGGF